MQGLRELSFLDTKKNQGLPRRGTDHSSNFLHAFLHGLFLVGIDSINELNCTIMGPMGMQIKHWALTENLTVFMTLGVDGGKIDRGEG